MPPKKQTMTYDRAADISVLAEGLFKGPRIDKADPKEAAEVALMAARSFFEVLDKSPEGKILDVGPDDDDDEDEDEEGWGSEEDDE